MQVEKPKVNEVIPVGSVLVVAAFVSPDRLPAERHHSILVVVVAFCQKAPNQS